MDDFEGEAYQVVPIQVKVRNELGDQVADADVYLWNGDDGAVSGEPWDFDDFIIENRLDDWLELFGGMELTGAEDD